jgi:tRNA-2-methylthio-N6-dimethylallyladenosine synthase
MSTTAAAPLVHLLTYGCQMNEHDSELIAGVLTRHGYALTTDIDQADVVLVNTCSVRENAEQRVLNRFKELKNLKRSKPGLKLGVCGCMAQRYGEKLFDMGLAVDVVAGPDAYQRLPELLAAAKGKPQAGLELSTHETYAGVEPVRAQGLSAWISIMRGCDNFCSYCIVPYVRGRERSLPAAAILAQLARLPESVREITLLGQNVNSYRDGDITFAQLLRLVDRAGNGRRIWFTTSHPRDFSDEIITAMAASPQVCPYVHLPLQAGSDRVLAAMHRGYTIAGYRAVLEKIKKNISPVGLTTDIMVGFPGETDRDFQQTLEMMQAVEFDNAFMFKYSPRPGTAAAARPDDVPESDKAARLTELITLQNRISGQTSRRYIGTTVEVLVAGPSKKNAAEWTGRTRTGKPAIFPRGTHRTGETINLIITNAAHATLFAGARD